MGRRNVVIDPTCELVLKQTSSPGCESRVFHRLWSPQVPGTWCPNVASSCSCSEMTAIGSRLMAIVPLPTFGGLHSMKIAIREIERRVKVVLGADRAVPLSRDAMARRYGSAKKRKYLRAAAVLDRDGICADVFSRLSMFVKAEKTNYSKGGSCAKPRVILARHPEYNLELGRHIQPLEHALYGIKGWRDQHVPPSRLIAKGLTWHQRASLISDKMSHFREPCVISVDAASFDQHVTSGPLALEHAFWKRLSTSPQEVERLLNMQLKSKGQSRHGVRFKIGARRCTGDPNTGCGNVLLMVAMVRAYMSGLGLSRWDLLDDGDDCLLFMEYSEHMVVKNTIVSHFLTFGQDLKVEPPVRDYSLITFCRSRPVFANGEYRLSRGWAATLSGIASSHKHFANVKERLAVMRCIAEAECLISMGTPIVQAVARAMVADLAGVKPAKRVETGVLAILKAAGIARGTRLPPPAEITAKSRASFEAAWGISPEEQVSLEKRLLETIPGFCRNLDRFGSETWVSDSGIVFSDLPSW